MKKLIIIVALLVFILVGCSSPAYGADTINAEQTPSPNEVLSIMSICVDKMAAAHAMAEAARDLGYEETHYVILLAKQEYQQAQDIYLSYHEFYSSWIQKEIEYPTAAYVWKFFKELGYSDQVCAGIIGNMMVECGAQSLNLQWDIYSPGGAFYGLCQWSRTYFPEIHGADLKTQCEYLRDNIETQINAFGPSFHRGYTYETFLATENAYDAGYAFCECYERGHGAGLRGKQAIVAYNYFTDCTIKEQQ